MKDITRFSYLAHFSLPNMRSSASMYAFATMERNEENILSSSLVEMLRMFSLITGYAFFCSV